MPVPFMFFPPKPAKTANPYLNANSSLLPRSALVPVDPETKERDFDGSTNRNPGHGPVNAYAMGSDPGSVSAGSPGGGPSSGYGASNYGAKAYGESHDIKFHLSGKQNAMFEAVGDIYY